MKAKKQPAVHVLGIDPNSGNDKGSGIGWATFILTTDTEKWVLDESGLIIPEYYSVPIERRMSSMAPHLYATLQALQLHPSQWRVLIEKPWEVTGYLDANNALWRTVGMCEALCALVGPSVELVKPSAWRKATCGNVKDREQAKKLAQTYAVNCLNAPRAVGSDEAEAVCIAFYGTLVERGLVSRHR